MSLLDHPLSDVPESAPATVAASPAERPMPSYAIALFLQLVSELEMTHWNLYQEAWDKFHDVNISGIRWSPYDWNDDTPESKAPNFMWHTGPDWTRSLELRWYKHAGRGMTCTVEWTPAQWCLWYDAISNYLNEYEHAHDSFLSTSRT